MEPRPAFFPLSKKKRFFSTSANFGSLFHLWIASLSKWISIFLSSLLGGHAILGPCLKQKEPSEWPLIQFSLDSLISQLSSLSFISINLLVYQCYHLHHHRTVVYVIFRISGTPTFPQQQSGNITFYPSRRLVSYMGCLGFCVCVYMCVRIFMDESCHNTQTGTRFP